MTTTTHDVRFDPDWSRGTRAPVTYVFVDSGTMMLATRTGRMSMDNVPLGTSFGHGPGCVWSGTGNGDGSYDTVTVTDATGTRIGLEVVFLSPTVDDVVEARSAHLTAPTAADWEQVRTDAKVGEKVDNWYREMAAITNAAFDELLADLQPTDDRLYPHPLTVLDVEGNVKVGDPCYGEPSTDVDLPAGRYVAVAWSTHPDGWPVARLGLYRVR